MNNNLPTVLITGANGQLGNEFRSIAASYPGYEFLFTDLEELRIDDHSAVALFFENHPIHTCINCAAYTAVDKAETEKEIAFSINADAVGNLALVCHHHQVQFIHISTDYIFDGTATQPYKETDLTCPVNSYGASKLKGEQLALQNNPVTIIIRSSWIYSSFGNNFVKTMLRLMKEKEQISVINDQTGCPTYAMDLAVAIMQLINLLPATFPKSLGGPLPTVFNYCNTGTTTWFEFAEAIKTFTRSTCKIIPISTEQYPTAAKRPHFSVLNTSKIQETFHLGIPGWKESLQNCLRILRE